MASKKKTAAVKPVKPVTRKAIKKALSDGPKSNKELRGDLGLEVEKCDPKLDRNLQQMRKSGELQIIGNRWAFTTVCKCPTCGGKGWIEKKPDKG